MLTRLEASNLEEAKKAAWQVMFDEEDKVKILRNAIGEFFAGTSGQVDLLDIEMGHGAFAREYSVLGAMIPKHGFVEYPKTPGVAKS